MNTTPEYEKIRWWHSIDLGNGTITPGHESLDRLHQEFNNLQLTAEMLQGNVSSISGVMMASCV